MSNLGGYQLLTTLAKKVGGPRNLVVLGMASGYVIFRTFEAGTKKVVKTIKVQLHKNKKESKYSIKTFHVTSDSTYDNGLIFNIGEQFNVLESDGEAVLIEKIGDSNNPYFVSDSFLKSISNYDL